MRALTSSHKPFRVVTAVLALLLSSTGADAAKFERSRAAIQKVLVESGVASVAVAAARNGEIVWEEGFGWADRERRVESTAHTMYSLASISKPITATGLMVLVDRGLIDLDRPINDYLGADKLTGRAGLTLTVFPNRTAGRLRGHGSLRFDNEAGQVW